MEQIIYGKKYDTGTAFLVASNESGNWDCATRYEYLYKTEKGNFFLHHSTRWEGERDAITPCSIEEAKDFYERLPEHEMTYKEAFGTDPEEA